MPVAGDQFHGTPAETVASLKEHPELVTCTSFPNVGYDFYVGYDPETETFTNRVVTLGAEPDDVDEIQVDEVGLSEEEILFHFDVLIERDAEVENPMLAMMRAIMNGQVNLYDDEDDD